MNCLPAFIGPTVCELDGPMPILNISNTLIMRGKLLVVYLNRPYTSAEMAMLPMTTTNTLLAAPRYFCKAGIL